MNDKLIKTLDTLYSKSYIKGIYCSGEAGNSKSYSIYKYLKENKVDYKLITARSSSLALYLLLYKHRKGLVVFDDVYFDRTIATDILKGALTEQGVVNWLTTSSKLPDDIPAQFRFAGKIIIITNKPITNNPLFYPLLSRMFIVEKNLSLKQYKTIAKGICKERDISKANIDYLISYLSPFLEHRDLRAVVKGVDYIKAGHRELLEDLFKLDVELVKLDELHKLYDEKSEIRRRWCKHTDKSRRSYYRILKKYKSAIVPPNNKMGNSD